MFDKPGEKVKTYAKVEFACITVALIIFAIWAWVDDIMDPFVVFLILVNGIAWSYGISLFLCAYGEMADSAEQTKDNSEKIIKLLEINTRQTKGTSDTPISSDKTVGRIEDELPDI